MERLIAHLAGSSDRERDAGIARPGYDGRHLASTVVWAVAQSIYVEDADSDIARIEAATQPSFVMLAATLDGPATGYPTGDGLTIVRTRGVRATSSPGGRHAHGCKTGLAGVGP